MCKTSKMLIVVGLVVVVGVILVGKKNCPFCSVPASVATDIPSAQATGLPRLIDLGATTCIPCKLMAPVLEGLKKEYAGRMQVDFIDVNRNPEAGKRYGVTLIPTQVLFDASGKELWRHEGFISKEDILAKWKELGVSLDVAAPAPVAPLGSAFERLAPAKAYDRAKDVVCYMCDGDIDARTLVVVKTDKGEVRLCSPHCYFIMYSCLTEDKAGFEQKVSVTDYAAGKRIAAPEAAYLLGQDEKTGRPWVRALSDADGAMKERAASGGNVVAWHTLQDKELSHRCGFCDRAVYPEDAALVRVGGLYTWGCCSHCALGVAARTGKDIEVHERDRLTGEEIVVKTVGGEVASLEPATAVAWFGLKKKPDGTLASAGCFHQGFFANAENLKKWVEQNPTETGKLISIGQALADKMKLSAEQVQKACKIGECAPK